MHSPFLILSNISLSIPTWLTCLNSIMPSTSESTTLLLLIPLLSQTALLGVAIVEPLSVQPFLSASPPISSPAIKAWCTLYVWRGLGAVLTFGVMSVTTGGVAGWKVGGWNGDGGQWYILGALASGSYFLFGAWAAQILDRLLLGRPLPRSPSLLEPTWGVRFRTSRASLEKSTLTTTITSQESESEALVIEEDETTKDELRRWLRMHYVRALVTGVPSWIFFLWAALAALSRH